MVKRIRAWMGNKKNINQHIYLLFENLNKLKKYPNIKLDRTPVAVYISKCVTSYSTTKN